jgi:hypothetical protein
LRVSLDAAEPHAFLAVRGKDMFARIVRNMRAFTLCSALKGLSWHSSQLQKFANKN